MLVNRAEATASNVRESDPVVDVRSHMRTMAIVAIFGLTVSAIAEGAFLFRLSRRVTALSQEVAQAHEAALVVPVARPEAAVERPVAAARPLPALRPAAVPPAFTAAAPAVAATATLRDALSTPEGREQLKTALDSINEQRRQERLAKYYERRDERDQRWRDHILKAGLLTGDEPAKVTALFAAQSAGRKQIMEDMRSGGKTSQETDDALDQLQENTTKSLHALVGDDRWRKLRETERRDRRQNGNAQAGQPQQQQQRPGG
jgi:hypothetical protein